MENRQFPYSTITILPTIDIKTVEQKLQENMKRDEYCFNYRHRLDFDPDLRRL